MPRILPGELWTFYAGFDFWHGHFCYQDNLSFLSDNRQKLFSFQN